jgi:hypothetical protein
MKNYSYRDLPEIINFCLLSVFLPSLFFSYFLAANRQTRMLADLALVNCYNKTGMSAKERDRILLSSAKRNLAGI